MRKVDELFLRYEESHRNPINKTIHWICVPLIMWSILAVLWAESPMIAYGVIALAVVFYLWLSASIAIGMLVVSALMVASLSLLTAHTLIVAIVVFVLAWIGQFVGHAIEGKRPTFANDLKFLLIGPAWLLHSFYRRVGIPY